MITRFDDHLRLAVHATPGAKRNLVAGTHGDALRVYVTSPADQGKANKAIVKLLADALHIRRRQIELSNGLTSRRKVFLIGNPTDELVQRIAKLAEMP
ncbi:DUF167 domain-containing protein [Planctomycetes bacterium K23_9]|uniref:UPF0235 protein K239x_40820 n=1 Tax=Stieleria marina TaxID=1930275 RepID=A0A517NY77_9BACT|nr:hypothetical protein K239x_40820 [Planctomycetes bacterium K23_9]